MNNFANVRIAGPTLPQEIPNGVQKTWNNLWDSKRHGLVVLCAAAWIIFPGDLDCVPIAGWVDDGFAMVLGVKHFLDLFRGDVTLTRSAMQEAIQRTKPPEPAKAQAADADVIDAEFVVLTDSRHGI